MTAFLGYSVDPGLRYKGTSGGVGSALLKYLFDKGIVQTSVSFDYDAKTLQYVPRLIHAYEEYQAVGSIYHEVALVDFIRQSVGAIQGGFACFCLPCQARAIRHIIEQQHHRCILLGLTCSSQQSIAATHYLLKRLGIRAEDVQRIQYRGNGWPSGIQIHLADGQTRIVPNVHSIWSDIFHSRLFIPPRCFRCENTLNDYADISLADPWLASLQTNVGDGKTLVMVNTPDGEALWREASSTICESEVVPAGVAAASQASTIRRKKSYARHPWKRAWLIKMNTSPWYRRLATLHPALFWLHNRLRILLERSRP
ncbi:MAG: Coenzyme F420 hydrogenase/dehydrogenase, beta subunit C-terminal domain [Kiritimatiellia bacterium]|jgi:coenzyme F420-reducing hydrogenase beta subunit|nr:Coenzyme F420 hydrogenase/dehydrogenase, beta subunit C-terminal domain [Kiritimatiellia bacterium]